MRLVRLTVHQFQCIEAADVEFGPGLNVLFGPNDLGKSSLAWAIRAVLLLQHNSSVHERFVSWYGDTEPRVQLILCDDTNRFWRVSKTFASGTAGRSVLEASKDGRTFTPDTTGRQVDDKLRTMFGWGIQGPGGTRGPRGLPESFLTQVLLAEQDSVRKVLFETSLADDPDEAGRLRLVEALGALAQDPLFKEVLDEAQDIVSTAFTPTGRKKKTAGSPFLEITEKLKALQTEHDELSLKVRETELAESKIHELNRVRDALQIELGEASEALVEVRREFEARQRRDGLHQQLQVHLAAVRSVEELQRKVSASEAEIAGLKRDFDAGAIKVQEVGAAVTRAETDRDATRAKLDALAHDDVDHDRRTRELEEQLKVARERFGEAERDVTLAGGAMRLARSAADDVASAAATADEKARLAKVAEAATAELAGVVESARQAQDDAAQRLRDANSDDRSRARELEQKELENRRLKRAAERVTIEGELRIATDVGKIVEEARVARTAHDALEASAAKARATLAAEEAKLATVETVGTSLRQLSVYGELCRVRETAEAAVRAAASAADARRLADQLRLEEAALRARLPPRLPEAQAITALRDLREQRRTADARLGGGISVTVRPKRSIAVIAKSDGVAAPATTTSDPVVFSANQVLALEVDDLVAIEVTAGEEGARRAAAELRERWNREGSRVLEDHNVDTIEQLEALRRDADATLRAADECRRNAVLQEERAMQASPADAADAADAAARLAELEAELGAAPREDLAARFARLGDRWQATLKRQIDDNAASHRTLVASLEELRAKVTRFQAQLDTRTDEVADLEAEATRRQADLTEGWSVLATRLQKALEVAVRDVENLERQAGLLTGTDSDAQLAAEKLLAEATQALALATELHAERHAQGQRARDTAVQAATKLEIARARARELDTSGVWSTALESTPLVLSVRSWQAAVTAAEELLEQRKVRRDAADERVAQHAAERADLIQRSRDASTEADRLVVTERARLQAVQVDQEALSSAWNQAQLAAADMKVALARTNVSEAQHAIELLRKELHTLEDEISAASVDADDVSRQENIVARLAAQLRDAQEDVAKAQGGLEQVGGAIVREQLREISQAIQHARERDRQIEVEFDAWKLLVETLRTTESTEGAHLGRALAGPVSARFRQLTSGRYDNLELGAHLEAAGLNAAGELRDISALSAGTQDQLATLLRLCIAEQLHSAIVLDDHLSQSDPDRVAWFNSVLRTAAQQVQIILITCRPAELLAEGELPRAGEPNASHAAGMLRSVDLSSVIRRFAPARQAR